MKEEESPRKIVDKRSIDYENAKKLCEEKITVSHLRNDRYSPQNQLGEIAQIIKNKRKKKRRDG